MNRIIERCEIPSFPQDKKQLYREFKLKESKIRQDMVKGSRREVDKRIDRCRQLLKPEKITDCLEQLLSATNNPWVAYELAREYEKAGDKINAFIYFDKAEDLFEDPNLKNMAQAAMNSLVIEEILDGKRKKRGKNVR